MLFEDLLLLFAMGSGIFFVGIPVWKFIRLAMPERRDPVAEAKLRLEVAKADAEAARLNKETEKVYENLYSEVLEDETTNDNNGRRI